MIAVIVGTLYNQIREKEGRKEEVWGWGGEERRRNEMKCYLILAPETSGLKMSALSSICYVVLGMPFNLSESHLPHL